MNQHFKIRNKIISMVIKCSAQYLKMTQKIGLELTKTVNKAYVIDKKNGNILWQDTIQKEMENVKITFQIIPEGDLPPNGFQYVNCHMIFDIKMENFQRKAYLVAGGHMTHTLDTITYSSVVMRDCMHCPYHGNIAWPRGQSSWCIECIHGGTQSWKDIESTRSRVWGQCW